MTYDLRAITDHRSPITCHLLWNSGAPRARPTIWAKPVRSAGGGAIAGIVAVAVPAADASAVSAPTTFAALSTAGPPRSKSGFVPDSRLLRVSPDPSPPSKAATTP